MIAKKFNLLCTSAKTCVCVTLFGLFMRAIIHAKQKIVIAIFRQVNNKYPIILWWAKIKWIQQSELARLCFGTRWWTAEGQNCSSHLDVDHITSNLSPSVLISDMLVADAECKVDKGYTTRLKKKRGFNMYSHDYLHHQQVISQRDRLLTGKEINFE